MTTTTTTTIACRVQNLLKVISVALLLIIGVMSVPLAAQSSSAIGNVGLTAGWATFGEAVPQGAAYAGLQVGSLPTQTDIKSRWPDGSIRFAVVTVNSPASASYAITETPAPTGTFTPTPPAASVALTVGTVTYVAALSNLPSSDLWLSGPLAYEARSVVSPISTADGSAHPFLRVNFDTRVYSDGTSRVDVSVENVLDMPGATTVTYNVLMTVNGQTVFAQSGVQHYYLTRWRKVVQVGAAAIAAVTPDFGPFERAKALPPYLRVVANVVSSPIGAAYNILNAGALDPNMPAHGGRPELAPYPDWTARYLVYKNSTQRSFVLANGDLSGSWPVHVRESATSSRSGVGPERLLSLDQRPALWYDVRAQGNGLDYVKGSPMPIVEYGSTTPGPGQSPLIPDDAHQPSIAYVPYLITGDRYYAEEMAFWANYSMLRTYPADGVRSSQGILAYNEVRGYAWALRNIVDAAAYYPDASPVRSYLSQKVTANLQWLDNYANAQDPAKNPFRILWLGKRPDGAQYIAMWEQNYLAYAIDRANKQGFAGGTAHRDAIAKVQLKLFTSDPDYPRAQGAPYVVGVGTPAGSGFTFFTTTAQIWSATQGNERPFAGYYGPEARLNLMIGVEGGWAGAQTAYDYLWPFIGTANSYCAYGGPDIPDLACRAGWALDFSGGSSGSSTGTVSTSPAQMLAPAAGSTLGSTSQTFSWTPGTGVSNYKLDIGSTVGTSDIYAGTAGTSLSATVSGLPTAGGTVWARLSSNINGVWQAADYSYTAYLATPSPAPTPTPTPTPPPSAPGAAVVVFAEGDGTRTTPSFSAAAGDLVVAFVGSDGPTSGGQSLTISGGGLAWTRVRAINAQFGASEIWSATAATASTLTVTATQAAGGYRQSLTVATFPGAGIGTSGVASGSAGAPTISLTTTQANAYVYGVGNDWTAATPRTPAGNQVLAHQFVDAATGDTYWVQSLAGPVSASGTPVQIADTAPSGDRWNLAAVEIVPAAATPLALASPSSGRISANAATITWTTNLAASSRVDFGSSTAYGATVVDGSQVTAHSVQLSALTPSTLYHFKISSQAGSGETVSSSDLTFVTGSQLSAAITAPTSGATTAGTVSVSANASGTSGVAGVQFMLDGGKFGNEVLAAPFVTSWTTTGVTDGTHTLTAVARDATGNSVVSAPVAVSVRNATSATPPAILIDKVVSADGKGALKTIAFSTASAGELLVAFAASDGPVSTAQTLTVSGAGLSWTLVRRVNTQAGTSEIWTAQASGTLSNVTVNATQGLPGYRQSLTVVSFVGAGGIGAASAANAAAGAPTVSLTTTVAGAMVMGVGNDWDRAIARTIGPNQTMVHQWVDNSTGDTYWVQAWKGSVPTGGTAIRLNDAAPTADRWNFAAVEIVPRAAATTAAGG
jgi:hypothetical protein